MTPEEEKLKQYLSALPSSWRDSLEEVLVNILSTGGIVCEDAKCCETLTSLSQFSRSITEISISFFDENKNETVRTFDVKDIMPNEAVFNCLISGETSNFEETIQTFIDGKCQCC